MVVIDSVRTKASSRAAAEKKIRAKAGKNLFVVCNPRFVKGKAVPGLWQCEVNYKKVK